MAPSPLLGFNNNVRHKGFVFHVQTEDSGVKHPHVITHLFMDGGRIVKTLKTSYADSLGKERYEDIVKKLMKEQHKAMFIALRDGELDGLIEAKMRPGEGAHAGPAATPEAPPPASAPVVAPAPEAVVMPPAALVARESEVPVLTRSGADLAEVTIPVDDETLRKAAEDSPAEVRTDLIDDLPPPAQPAAARIESGSYREVNDRDSRKPPPVVRQSKRPPPPSSGGYSEVVKTPSRRPERVSDRAKARSKPPTPAPAGRPAPEVARTTGRESLFGNDHISEQSLDEVILGYLAEDLDPTSKR